MKLFLVEDEGIALCSLQQKIEDLDDSWEIVGTAFNGVQALERIPSCHPDILITDIRMPDMDGLELIGRLRDSGIDLISVIVSGFQDFDYARQAVRLGVKDYLLKPVDPADLKQCLTNCQTYIEEIHNRETVQTLLADPNTGALAFSSSVVYCAYLIIANALNDYDHFQHPSVPYLQSSQLEAAAKPLLAHDISFRCVDGFFTNEKALLLSSPPEADSDHVIASLLSDFAAAVSALSEMPATVFYQKCDTRQQLDSTFIACRRGAAAAVILGQTTVTCTQHKCPSDPKVNEHIRMISIFLRQNQMAELRKYVQSMVEAWERDLRPLSKIQTDLIFILTALRQLSSGNKNSTVYAPFFIENIICFSGSYAELAENFYLLLLELFVVFDADGVYSGEQLVSHIDAYLQANLSEMISLQILSEKFSLSKAYLCRIFKRVKNTTPMDYFMHLKIERAQQMLTKYPEMPVREIASSVGFNDFYYFSKVFKRFAGVSPSEYRLTHAKASSD